jgi:hypothetical protein
MSCLKTPSDGIRIVKRCERCKVAVCATCIEKYYPDQDMGLQLFTVDKAHAALVMYRYNLELEKDGCHTIDQEKYAQTISRLREEFYDTEQHRADLRAQITEAEARFLVSRAELADAEKRARISSFVGWCRRRETGCRAC